MEKNYDDIVIRIPADIYSINPSFFEELFFNVVQKLKKEGFVKKFKIQSLGEYNFQNELLEAVDRILNDTTAIDWLIHEKWLIFTIYVPLVRK